MKKYRLRECVRIVRVSFSAVAAAVAFSASAATWTGGGDGVSWGNAANWGGAIPGSTEDVTINTGSTALTIDLGATERTCGTITVNGSAKLTLSGSAALVVQTFKAFADVDINVPVTLKTGDNTICAVHSTLEFKQAVTASGTGSVWFTTDGQAAMASDPSAINFRSTFTGESKKVKMNMGKTKGADYASTHFYGKLTIASIENSPNYQNGFCYLHCSGNDIGYISLCYGGIVCEAENVFPDDLCITWNNYYCENNSKYGYKFNGFDQVIGGLTNTWTYPERDECRYLTSNNDMTLTLKGRQDCYVNCYVNDRISIVWDPVGDFTQEFALKTSTMDGTITVKRGKVKVSEGASFANVNGIAIMEGAVFELTTEKSSAIASLANLNVKNGGKLKISSASMNAMSGCLCVADIEEGGVIEADADVVLAALKYKGAFVTAGVYGPEGTAVPWATGSAQIIVSSSGEVSQEARYWTGLGDGKTWTDNANWDTKAPASLDSAFFTKNATITSAVEVFGARKFNVEDGCTVTLSGTVSGPADITKEGAGSLVLTGSNTFTGSLLINKGRVTGRGENSLGDNALGTIDVSKKNDTLDANLVLGGVTVRKSLIVRNRDDASNSYKNQLACEADTVNVILGELNVPNSYLRSKMFDGSKLIVAGGGVFSAPQFFTLGNESELIITNVPIIKKVYEDITSGGWYTFAVPGNTYLHANDNRARGVQNKIRTTVNGAFSSSSYFYFGKGAIFDLCGTTQSISRIEAITTSSQDWTPAASGTIKSDLPALLTFNSGNSYTNSAVFAGNVSLEQAGEGPLYLTAESTTTGELIASAGRIIFMEGAKWNGRIVMNGGSLEVANPGALSTEASLSLKSGTLNLPEGEYYFASVTDADGNPVPPGRYSSSAVGDVQVLAGLSGPGILTVFSTASTPATYVWTGNGDGRFTTPANWEDGVLPDFNNSEGVYVFPGNGFTATVDTNVFAKSFEFPSASADTAKFSASGSGGIMFVDGGIVVTSATAVAKSVVFDVPLKYAKTFKALVGDPGDIETRTMSLVFSNSLSTVGTSSFMKDGCGNMRLVGDGNSIHGDMTASNGFFYVSGKDPLGGTGVFRYYSVSGRREHSAFVADNAVVTREIVCYNADDYRILMSEVASTNLFTEKVSNKKGHFRIYPSQDSVITFAGGMQPVNFLIMQPFNDGTGYCVISNTPLVLTQTYWTDMEGECKNVIACAGNSFTGNSKWHVNNTLELTVNNAIRSDNIVNLTYTGNKVPKFGKLEILGTTQEIAQITRQITTNENGTVKYLSPGRVNGLPESLLKLSGSQNTDILPVFTGAASFINAGTAERHLRNSCTSTGNLDIVGGTLVMEAPGAAYYGVAQPSDVMDGGSWAGLKVTLSGGEVQVNHSKAFARHVSLFVPYGSTGKMNLASGVLQNMEYLYLQNADGEWVRQPIGKWGAAGSGAGFTADCFSGAGVINFLGDGIGTVVILR